MYRLQKEIHTDPKKPREWRPFDPGGPEAHSMFTGPWQTLQMWELYNVLQTNGNLWCHFPFAQCAISVRLYVKYPRHSSHQNKGRERYVKEMNCWWRNGWNISLRYYMLQCDQRRGAVREHSAVKAQRLGAVRLCVRKPNTASRPLLSLFKSLGCSNLVSCLFFFFFEQKGLSNENL